MSKNYLSTQAAGIVRHAIIFVELKLVDALSEAGFSNIFNISKTLVRKA